MDVKFLFTEEKMSIFSVFTLLGGLAIFLFGMNVMGEGLEKRSGDRLKSILEHLTSSPIKGLLLGVGVTAIIQSSSATTVMVVGFVNSGIMKLSQSIGVIMGAKHWYYGDFVAAEPFRNSGGQFFSSAGKAFVLCANFSVHWHYFCYVFKV